MTKEELLLQKRFVELSKTAFNRGIVMFSDFLNLNELNILHTTPKAMFSSRYETFGGYGLSERQMAAFLPDALYYEYQYPITALEIRPAAPKFAEALTHRDYLGAVMNLGIERSKLGDILTYEDAAVLFVKEELASYITEQLSRVRHTVVKTTVLPSFQEDYEPKYETIRGTVPSIRLDTVLSLAFPISRSKITDFIEGGRVFVNGRLITSNGYRLNSGDYISVRKMGRIMYEDIITGKKKGRFLISVRKYGS